MTQSDLENACTSLRGAASSGIGHPLNTRFVRLIMVHIFRSLAAVWLFLGGADAYAGNISGTYVGLYTNAADMLQIVERPDGSILGRFEQVILTAAGTSIDRMNASVSGAVSGNTVVLTLKPAEFMGGTIPMSGMIEGDAVRLSGGANGGSFNVVAQRSTESAFAEQAQRLIARANQTSAFQAEEKAVAKDRKDIVQVTQRMRDISNSATVHIKRSAAAPAVCAEYTKKMEVALAKEGGFPPGSYARSQLDYAVSSIAFNFNLWHDGLQRVEFWYGYSNGKIVLGKNLKDQISSAQVSCSAPGWAISPLCKNFFAEYAGFQTTNSQLEEGFTAAEAAWHAEHAKQKTIEKQADALSR
jgi:hypothetical protein